MKRIIFASSSLAFQFAEMYDSANPGDRRNEHIFEEIHEILDKYGTVEDDVDVTFDRADRLDKRRLLSLAESLR